MTTATDLVRRAISLGASLWAEGESLELDAPADFPDELIDLLREHKAAVLRDLTGNTCTLIGTSPSELLAWASELAERDMVLPKPVSYVEVPLRTVSTCRVSSYVAHYLKTISAARLYQGNPELCWRPWTREWWKEREDEALGALASLRKALEGCQNDVS